MRIGLRKKDESRVGSLDGPNAASVPFMCCSRSPQLSFDSRYCLLILIKLWLPHPQVGTHQTPLSSSIFLPNPTSPALLPHLVDQQLQPKTLVMLPTSPNSNRWPNPNLYYIMELEIIYLLEEMV